MPIGVVMPNVPTWRLEMALRWVGPLAGLAVLSALAIVAIRAQNVGTAIPSVLVSALLILSFVFRWHRDRARSMRVRARFLAPGVSLVQAFTNGSIEQPGQGTAHFGKGWYEVEGEEFVATIEADAAGQGEIHRIALGDIRGANLVRVQSGRAYSRVQVTVDDRTFAFELTHPSGSSYLGASDELVGEKVRRLRDAIATADVGPSGVSE